MNISHKSMVSAYKDWSSKNNLNQDDLATSLGVDKGLISRRLKGSINLTLKTLSHMASAMDCKLSISFEHYDKMPLPNMAWGDDTGWSPPSSTTDHLVNSNQMVRINE
jgi:transcriptional regulator with XRE-family HTH domain